MRLGCPPLSRLVSAEHRIRLAMAMTTSFSINMGLVESDLLFVVDDALLG